jgi:hypothetical protein
MIALRLLRSFGIWNAGEVAGFHAERAQALIADGFAELSEKPEAQEQPQDEASAELAEETALPVDEKPMETVVSAKAKEKAKG